MQKKFIFPVKSQNLGDLEPITAAVFLILERRLAEKLCGSWRLPLGKIVGIWPYVIHKASEKDIIKRLPCQKFNLDVSKVDDDRQLGGRQRLL